MHSIYIQCSWDNDDYPEEEGADDDKTVHYSLDFSVQRMCDVVNSSFKASTVTRRGEHRNLKTRDHLAGRYHTNISVGKSEVLVPQHAQLSVKKLIAVPKAFADEL